MEILYQAIKNIIIFLLLVTVLQNLVGQSSYKKYINIFVGLVLIIIVITPILKVLNSNTKVDRFYNQNVYRMNAADLGEQLVKADKTYQKTILKEYKEKIEAQIKTSLKGHKLATSEVCITVNEDVESEECGKIQSIKIHATKEEDKKTEDNTLDISSVDKVTIDKITINDATKAAETSKVESDKYDTVEELTVKEELSALYGIEQEHIEVSIA